MAATADKTDPKLWQKVKEQVVKGDKGGKPGQWSARKAQLAVSEYKHEGGGYKGEKDPHNHLVEWQKEEWDTKSGQESGQTGERYLPKRAREALTDEEYKRTTAKKRKDSAEGHQFSAQPKDVAEKTAPYRSGRSGTTKTDLLKQAAAKGVRGRSRMTKQQLEHALK